MTPFDRAAPPIAAAALLLCVGAAHAVDWGGYFRAGPGATTTSGASRACYGLPGEGMKYRLGNECDIYGEFTLSQAFRADGVEYKALLMTNLWNGDSDIGDARLGINQMYVEAKGLDFAPGANFWIGKRFYQRQDVHIVDSFFTNLSGVGAGVDGIATGFGKLGVAYFKTSQNDRDTDSGQRVNVQLYDMPVNEGGALAITGTYTRSRGDDADPSFGRKNGAALGLQHTQARLFGTALNNVLWVQAAQGTAAPNGNFGNLNAGSGYKTWRVIESVNWQTGPFGGQAMALYQHERAETGLKTKSISVGGRLSYALTKNFKLLGEVGHSQRKPDNADTARVTKVTLAPTLSTGPKLFDRPELRFYVTHARWNAAAGNITGEPAFAGRTSGTSYGAQVEIWF